MIRSRVLAVLAAAAAMLVPGPMAPSATAAGPEPVVNLTKMAIDEVSFDGRYLWDGDAEQVVDRLTGARSAAPTCSGHHCRSAGFVRDNPSLVLQFEYGPRPVSGEEGDYEWNASPLTGVYLVDTANGARQRIDADSAGTALVPAWSNQRSCGNEWCDNFYDFPGVFVHTGSVSRDGRTVAFCTNYDQPKVPVLYVKDLRSGRLTKTALRCPVMEAMGGESTFTRAPEISADGRVIHVNGDVFGDGYPSYRWTADSLYFARTGTSRAVKGWGSMTRDGATVFMRIGVPRSAVMRSRIAVGAYRVSSRKVTRIPGRDRIYGTDVSNFSASDLASYRGRFVVGAVPIWSAGTSGTITDVQVSAADRRTGATTDVSALLRAQGYEPELDQWWPRISGDGTVVFAVTTSGPVAITRWEPTARAKVAANATQSKLVVDVDPDKGSGYWTLRVQAKRADGTWRTLKKTYRTQGKRETRTIDLPAGAYRVVVKAKYGYKGSTSGEVILAR